MKLPDPVDGADGWVRLPWDTNHFGFPIGRLITESPSEDALLRALRSAELAGLRCLYWLSDTTTSRREVAERNGFRLVDTRLEFEIRLPTHTSPTQKAQNIRVAEESDLDPLKVLAAKGHRNTRFYADGQFPIDRADAMYAAWIEGSFRDPTQSVYISGPPGEPSGYIAFGSSEGKGVIGLVGVEESEKGKGLGSALVTEAVCRFAEQGVEQVDVVTQGDNRAAVRLYTRLGFSERKRAAWFHRWFGI
jgi:dTDP-4-amino-4,6-dideoxy-D-galactose acyltransferase